jgi:indole-3-glycerol phosphate synthase
MNVLAAILDHAWENVRRLRERTPVTRLIESPLYTRPVLSLEAALRRPGLRVIAEIKKASPSRGVIRKDFHPVDIAMEYAEAEAAAISVLTEEKFFQGSLASLTAIRERVNLPLLRKDFIVDEYQIHEARAAGADAVLLIVGALGRDRLSGLMAQATRVGLECLVEVHDERELAVANEAGAALIGINNRDLATFTTDLGVSLRLASLARADAVVVSESGIGDAADIARLHAVGIRSVLVGESFMRAPHPGKALRAMVGPGGVPE